MSRNFLYVFANILFILLGINSHAFAHKHDLNSAIQQALKSNPTMEEMIQALESARMEKGVAQSYFWPRLSLVASKNRLRNSGSVGNTDELSNTNLSKGLRATWSLFAGFTHLNNFQRARIEEDIAREELRYAELELIANIQIQFFLLLQARRDLNHAEKSIRRIETQLEAAQSFADVGMAPYVNVLQNKVELSQAQERLITTKNAVRSSEILLNGYLGYSPDIKVSYEGILEDYPKIVDFTENEALRLALENRPDIRIAQKSIEAAKKTVLSTAGEAFPQVDLTTDWMSYRRDYASHEYDDYDRHYWSIGINFTWTFFEGGKSVFGVARDKRRVNSLEASYESTISSAKTDVLKSMMDLMAANEVYATAKEGLKVAEENYGMASSRYQTKTGTITELLDAQDKLTEAEVRLSKSLADFQIARVKLFFNIGVKNTSLQ